MTVERAIEIIKDEMPFTSEIIEKAFKTSENALSEKETRQ